MLDKPNPPPNEEVYHRTIGTFFLVLTIGMVTASQKGDFAPIAIGSVLFCMVFAGAYISGAYYNPAVTLAVLLRGRIPSKEALAYISAQLIGGIMGAYMVIFLQTDKMPAVASILSNRTNAIIAELLGTFSLSYVVLNVRAAKGTIGNMFYGFAIGVWRL